jgi:hypothetical protein
MVRTVVLTIALLFLTVDLIAAGQNTDKVLSIQGFDGDRTQLFMSGMGYGVTFLNMMLLVEGKPPFYCPPAGVTVNGRVLWELASQVLEGPNPPEAVAIAALEALKKTYACGE